jgi:diguanylate cyclase (GGDEF)-like protein
MKILLIDDAKSVVKVMTARLSSYGHDVVHAGNGSVGVELFRDLSPDLVLMDVEMPVMNGFEATSRIRAVEAQRRWAWTPIIFLTSSDTVENLVTAIEAGGDDFMSKFVPEPVLQAKMKAMGRIAQLRHSLSSANQKLQNLADRDGLTGLFNRRRLDLDADLEWSEATANARPFGLMMIDIDHFKKYNDCYGHQAGDDCLRAVAKAIEHAVDQTQAEGLIAGAFAARYGGEEFTVVVPNATPNAMTATAERIVQAVRALNTPHERNEAWRIVTLSIGGAWVGPASGELASLFRQADARLYMAKQQGRNRAQLQD